MALSTRTLPALMNGISRQPAIMRSSDQTEDELNTWGDIARGVTRRPPTELLAKLTLSADFAGTLHHINRDVSERYLVAIDAGTIKVFDEATGAEKTVNAPLGLSYLSASGDLYRAVTVADYTFIVNTTTVVKLKPVAADEADPDARLRHPGGSNPRFVRDPADAPSVYAGDTYQYLPNPSSAGGLTGVVAKETDLPTPPTGIYKVAGSADNQFVSYYVRANGSGSWDETVLPGLANALDETTMPHALIREADGTFTFAPFSWQPRRVGDLDSNPAPTFVEQTIRDVFFYQNRLAFLSDETVIFSAAGDYGDFWRRTVLDYIDSDVIAASAATTDVTVLDYAVPFSDGVMLFSKQRQLSLTNADSGLSAHSLAIAPVTKYLMAPAVRPTPMGSQVHFVTSGSGKSAVQEYTRLAGANPTEASDITAHVPDLLPQGVTELIPAPDLDALFVIAHGATGPKQAQVFVYQFFWDGDKKLQSAWRKWDFPGALPVSGAYESGKLLLLLKRGTEMYLETVDLSTEAASENQCRLIFLDQQESLTGVYDAGTNRTTFTSAHPIDPDRVRVVRGIGWDHPEDVLSPVRYIVSGNTVSVDGDESAHPMTIGHVFTTSLTVSQQFPFDWQGRAVTSGRLVLHSFSINLTETAYTRAEVYPYGAAAHAENGGLLATETFTGRTIGTVSLGEQSYYSGPWTFNVSGNSKVARIDLINDSPFSSTWTSAEWEGLFFSKAI